MPMLMPMPMLMQMQTKNAQTQRTCSNGMHLTRSRLPNKQPKWLAQKKDSITKPNSNECQKPSSNKKGKPASKQA